jgi:hypothetical protein
MSTQAHPVAAGIRVLNPLSPAIRFKQCSSGIERESCLTQKRCDCQKWEGKECSTNPNGAEIQGQNCGRVVLNPFRAGDDANDCCHSQAQRYGSDRSRNEESETLRKTSFLDHGRGTYSQRAQRRPVARRLTDQGVGRCGAWMI